MRTFNEFEKVIIRRIVEHNQHDFVALIDPFMVNKEIEIDYTLKTAVLHFDQAIYLPNDNPGAAWLINEVMDISDKIITIISLLDYLQLHNYLKLIQSAAPPVPSKFGRLIQGNIPINYNIYDKEIVELLLKNSFKNIIVEQSLVDLVTDNFKTKEEIRHTENIRWAKRAFIATIIIGSFSLIVNSIATFSPSKRSGCRMNNDTSETNQQKKQFKSKAKNEENQINVKIVNDFNKDTFKIKIDNELRIK